jgi:CRP-like cAMP-binding protein
VGQLGLYHEAVIRDVLTLALAHTEGSLLWDTAVWALAQLNERVVDRVITSVPEAEVAPILRQIKLRRSGQEKSLPTIAKVDILKRTGLFAETRDETLTDVAIRLTEVHFAADEIIIAKGAQGNSMYMIVAGKVRVHDGERTLNILEAADVFGELALLDPEPRAASVSAVTPTHLLRLAQEPFRELLASQPSLSRGIIRALSRYLRAWVRDLAELRMVTRLTLSVPVTEMVDSGEATAVSAPLTHIERIILLKRVDLFRHLPNSILTELAMLLREVTLMADETVFAKGDPGDALYIIAQGKVRVHDGDHTLNYLQEGQVFGEMALLDPEPRLAGVTAVTSIRLLRLDQTPFYQLLEDHVEIASSIFHILSSHLRNRMKDLTDLKASLSN